MGAVRAGFCPISVGLLIVITGSFRRISNKQSNKGACDQ